MKYVCDAPGGNTWFRIETEAEAASESDGMRHAVEKFFRKEQERRPRPFTRYPRCALSRRSGSKRIFSARCRYS